MGFIAIKNLIRNKTDYNHEVIKSYVDLFNLNFTICDIIMHKYIFLAKSNEVMHTAPNLTYILL